MATENRKLVEEKWLLFLSTAIRPGMNPEVVDLLKNTFYCGASALFDVMTNTIASIEGEEDACKATQSIYEELEERALKIALRAMKSGMMNSPRG